MLATVSSTTRSSPLSTWCCYRRNCYPHWWGRIWAYFTLALRVLLFENVHWLFRLLYT